MNIRMLTIAAALLATLASQAQTAREVLDKAAKTVSAEGGVTADFSMTSSQYGSASGTIAVKGRRFKATTEQAVMWFNGKTQWTYLKKSDEVSVVNPTEAQLQAINPYNFITMYREGYAATLSQNAAAYVVHLTSTEPTRKVKEMFVTVSKKTYAPTEVKLLQGTRWTTFAISNLKRATLSDDEFEFHSKDYPSAEVIDLR